MARPSGCWGCCSGRLRERGLLGKGGRQRTDATHVHMAVRDLHQLEQVIETLRAALEALAVVAPAWLGGLLPRDWTRRYGQRGDAWRLPTSEQARSNGPFGVGRDGYLLLEAVSAPDAGGAGRRGGGAGPAGDLDPAVLP